MKRVVSNIVVFPTANSLERLIEYVSSMNTHPFTDYYNNPCANTASIFWKKTITSSIMLQKKMLFLNTV